VYTDRETGKPPSDATVEKKRVVKEKDFNLLMLDL